MRKTIILLYLISICFQTLNAQTKSNFFVGQVLDKETKEPIPFATIIAKKMVFIE
ncbi:carboxypeptidase-like regulatory domain-containing protein [Tenacibaculum holothuriorum]|uniref:carboxypeptidase-like regulatory domain-containing protein n=1 Tax=Tenacibaculum holothuriorum TaxID=1635173 RepID=UPI00117DC3D0|nr:carboxypeptidase-like regulatory domain-containing protein [Tenacibaculum holothuriorum]